MNIEDMADAVQGDLPPGFREVRNILLNPEDVELHDGAKVGASDRAPYGAAMVQPRAERRREAKRQLAPFSAASLAGVEAPARQWLAENLVPTSTVTMLGGDGGTGKSLIAMQLAASVAGAALWAGRKVASGRVIYISAEDDRDELHRRLTKIAPAQGLDLADLDGLTIVCLAGQDAVLARPAGANGPLKRTDLMREVEDLARDVQPVLIVFDTLADFFGGNENDRAQTRQFIGMLGSLAIREECAVLLLSHPSLTGISSGSGLSGSTAWNNSVRSRLYLDRPSNDLSGEAADRRVLRCLKSNYARAGEEIELRWQDGAFLPLHEDGGLDHMAAGSRADRVFLRLLGLMAEQGRDVSPSPSRAYAPSVFAEHPEAEGVTKRAFATAMERLLHSGRVRVAKKGPASRASNVLELVK